MIKIAITIVGCGSSGSAIAAQLAKKGIFSKINLVDSDMKKIKRLLIELNKISNNIDYTPFEVDATNTESVQKVLSDVNVLINAASPICNISLMKACLNSCTNYIDLASDPFSYAGIANGTTLDEQLELNSEFVDNCLVAVTNTGFSPGFTDILCKHVVNEHSLDLIEYFKVYFAEKIESDRFVVSWSPYILLLEAISQSTIYKKSEIIYLDSQQSSKNITFPHPVGRIKVRPFNGHPELRTIPQFLGIPIEYIEISGGMQLNNMQLNDIIVEALRRKVKESVIFKGDVIGILSESFENPDTFAENYKKGIIKKEAACCLIEIKGRKNNETFKYNAEIQHDIKDEIKNISVSISAFLVSFTPSIIANKLELGKIKEKGVIAPAALSIASEVISECKEMGMNIKECHE